MKTTSKIFILGLVMVMALCYANSASAESDLDTGAGAEASVNLNFQIVIPRFIYFRVGTAGVTIDTINFNPLATDVATPGNITAGGVVDVDLISNGGTITINTTVTGGGLGLSDGGTPANYISYGQIITANTGNITAPTLTNGGAAAVIIPSAGVTVESATWTYTYLNPVTPPVPGTYNGMVTYAASIP